MKILFISTLSLSSNPRLAKEIQLSIDHNYSVEVICFLIRNGSFAINEKILERFSLQGVKFHCIEAGKEAGVDWFRSVVKEKYYRFISKVFTLKGRALGLAVSRRSMLLLQTVKKINQADWVIGHNPGALYATQWTAKKLNARSGFDVEDYHPGEGNNIILQQLTKHLMQEVLPTMNYVSFAAPLIRDAVKTDLGKEGCNWITVLNYFPAAEFVTPIDIEGPLKLVWFSQYISAGRGLEYILPLILKFPLEMELHLFGKPDKIFYESHLKPLANVIVHVSLSQKDLHNMLSNYDVGLALEPKKDLNNGLAISNKLLAYLQAGLFVLASDTSAQRKVLYDLPNNGIVFNLKKSEEGELIFSKLLKSIAQIRTTKQKRFNQFQNMHWEIESKKLIDIWN